MRTLALALVAACAARPPAPLEPLPPPASPRPPEPPVVIPETHTVPLGSLQLYRAPQDGAIAKGRPLRLELVHCDARDVRPAKGSPKYTVRCAAGDPAATTWHHGTVRSWALDAIGATEQRGSSATIATVTAALRAHKPPVLGGDVLLALEVATSFDVTTYRMECGDAVSKDLLKEPELDERLGCPKMVQGKPQRSKYPGRDAHLFYGATQLAMELDAPTLDAILGFVGSGLGPAITLTLVESPSSKVPDLHTPIAEHRSADLLATLTSLKENDRDLEHLRRYNTTMLALWVGDVPAFRSALGLLAQGGLYAPAEERSLDVMLGDTMFAAFRGIESGALVLHPPAGLDAYVAR